MTAGLCAWTIISKKLNIQMIQKKDIALHIAMTKKMMKMNTNFASLTAWKVLIMVISKKLAMTIIFKDKTAAPKHAMAQKMMS